MSGTSGSPLPGEPEYLLVGTLRKAHGLRGEVLMHVLTDFPERLAPKARVFLGDDHTPTAIVSHRPHGGGLLLQFEGVDTPEAAGLLRNQSVYVQANDRPRLPSGHYYHHELLGSTVIDENDETVGVLGQILQTGANDVYVVKLASGKELLLPVLASVVLTIDPDQHLIRVRLPAGLEPSGGD